MNHAIAELIDSYSSIITVIVFIFLVMKAENDFYITI